MKAHLLYEDRDFDFTAELPPGSADLIQDLELTTILNAMAAGDRFLFDVSARVLLTGLPDPGAVRYRQRVLADCLAEPEIIREMYRIAVAALQDRRGVWGFRSSQNPTTILSGAVGQLDVLITRLQELRQVADGHAKFSSGGLAALFRALQRELDDAYFDTLASHLRQLRFRSGELMSAQLDRDNSGINYVLRSGSARRGWRERVGIEPRSSYSFTLPPRDEAGAQVLQDMTSRAVNLVANAAAQSADHVSSYFTMLRAELGFYVSCLNLADRLAAKGYRSRFPTQRRRRRSRSRAPTCAIPAWSWPHQTRSPATTCTATGNRYHHHRRHLRREIHVPAQRRRGPAHDAMRVVRHRPGLPGQRDPRDLHPLHPGRGHRHDQRAAGRRAAAHERHR